MDFLLSSKFNFFSELMLNGSNLHTWVFDHQLNLISSNFNNIVDYEKLFSISNFKDFLVDNPTPHLPAGPVLFIDNFEMSWIVDFNPDKSSTNAIFALGPSSNRDMSNSKQLSLLLQNHISTIEADSIIKTIHTFPSIPLVSWLEFGIMLHYTITGDVISTSNFRYLSDTMPEPNFSSNAKREPKNNTWYAEQNAMQAIENGRLDYQEAFKSLANSTGSMINYNFSECSRSAKNDMITFIALATRAAIRGGLDAPTAYYLGELYVDAVENSSTMSDLMNINHKMIEDFVQRVHKIRTSQSHSVEIESCINYIELHLHEKISISQIAPQVGYSDLYLAQKFRKETGKTFTEFVQEKKTEKAKLLLLSTNKPIVEISETLGYCNPSHFTDSFKKTVGMTPGKYREKGGN